jgi:asparagine synthase (glutamine-hydrolysing)
MAHSLELRTPLVDVTLLAKLAPYVPAFTGGVGKAMLAQSPDQPLPESIINRPKTGFELPMDKWLTQATDHSEWADSRQLSASRSPWARRWATRVLGAVA